MKTLIDRFQQIYGFRDNMQVAQTQDFTKKISIIRKRKPHNYNFLRKYLIYASRISVVKITPEAEQMLNEFWIRAKVQGLLSVRMYDGLFRIAAAQAKLQLKTQVDEEIAEQVMESVLQMMAQYGPTVAMISSPKDVTYKKFLEILQNTRSGIVVEELCKIACHESIQISEYLGKRWSIDSNHKVRTVVDLLLNHENIKRTQGRPMVLQWVDSTTTYSDYSDYSDIDSNESLETKPMSEMSEMSERGA